MSDELAHIAWECRTYDFGEGQHPYQNCPVTELSRIHLTSLKIGIMLKLDWDTPLYSENGENYLQIMVAEVADGETSTPLTTGSQGIFLSFEVAAMIPTTCPDYDGGSIIFNIEGGGGTREGTVTTDYSEYISALED